MTNTLRRLKLFLLLCLFALAAGATHYRAGEITYRQISVYTFEITVITYTDPSNQAADRQEIEVDFGDGKTEVVPRANGKGQIVNPDINNTVKMNIYRTTHTFPGPTNAGYLINITDPNRVDGVKNINGGNSVNIPFYVESLLTIKEGIGNNQSPVLLLPPLDVGCVNEVFTHNPIAYDPDGDSLAFTIIAPKRAKGQEVPNFTIPQFSDSFKIHINTGQLTWARPMEAGHYNWAILIREFRGGKIVGYVVRDMQVYINNNCDNSPPLLNELADTCVEVNDLVQRKIRATDPNPGQTIKISYYGGPFIQQNSPATMTPNAPEGPASGTEATFTWKPSCNAIRYRAHQVGFRATDNHFSKPLSRITNWNIKVVGPAPKNVKIVQDSNGFKISWDRDTCRIAMGYKIYRKVDSSYWKHAPCETGVPASTGYRLLDTTKGVNNTSYFDNNNGMGISPLVRYCYIITSQYYPRNENGTILLVGENTESYASDEVCDMVVRTEPILTRVSVLETSTTTGKMELRWIRPELLDTSRFKAPYKYRLLRSEQPANGFAQIGPDFDYNDFASLNDTTYVDTALNTAGKTWYYQVQLYTTRNGNLGLTETSASAGSVFVTPFNTNRTVVVSWSPRVPWVNQRAVIFRKNGSGLFDSIGITLSNSYADTGLNNGSAYCYKVQTIGNYNPLYYAAELRNFSQEVCGTPVDTIRPCSPALSIDTPCNGFINLEVKLNWTYPSSCDQDVVRYRIFWRENSKSKWVQIDSTDGTKTSYADTRSTLKLGIAGCYAVVAVDSFNNASPVEPSRCIDNCPFYQLPNAFTPGDPDGFNDMLKPYPYRFIDHIDLNIYNRWGQVVYATSNPEINWNGKDQDSGKELSEGIYFYIADVYEKYLDGTKKRTIRGTITLIR